MTAAAASDSTSAALLARALRTATALILVVIALRAEGGPDALTLVITGLCVALAALARALVRRHRQRRRAAAIAVGGVLLAAVSAGVLGEPGTRPIQLSWLALVAVPLGLLLVPLPASRRLLGRRHGFLVLSIAVGLSNAPDERQLVDWVLIATLTLLAAAQLSLATVDRTARRSPDRSRLPPLHDLTRTVLCIALLALACSALCYAAIQRLPRLLRPRPPPSENALPEGAASRWLGGSTPAALSGDTLLARVGFPGRSGNVEEAISEVYLRTRVLDDLRQDASGTYLVASTSRRDVILADLADQRLDHKVTVPDPPPADQALQSEITLLQADPDCLLLLPLVRWVEGDEHRIRSDQSWQRPPLRGAVLTYRMESAHRTYRRRALPEVVLAAPEHVMLPFHFPEQRVLQQRVDRLLAGVEDDLQRAQVLEGHVRRTGTFAPLATWPGSVAEFLAGAREGNSSHFAQAFAILARVAGLPARVAVGFRTRRFDPELQAFLVQADDVHYWGEVNFRDLGWLGFEPTPEAPEEVERWTEDPGEPAPPAGQPAGAVPPVPPPQEEPPPAWGAWISALLLLAVVLVALFYPERLAPPGAPPITLTPQRPGRQARRAWRYWQQFLDLCSRNGMARDPAQTATEFLAALPEGLAPHHDALQLLRRCYLECRFGRADLSPQDESGLKGLLRKLPAVLREVRPKPPARRRRRRRRRTR